MRLVTTGRDEGDEDARLAKRRQFSDGTGTAAANHDVGGGQDVGKLPVDEVDHPVAVPERLGQARRNLAQRGETVLTGLVQHLAVRQHVGKDRGDEVVDLRGSLCTAGNQDQRQTRIQLVCGEPAQAVTGQHFRADGVAGDYRTTARSGWQVADRGLVAEQHAGGQPCQDPVGQPKRGDLLVHDQRAAEHPAATPTGTQTYPPVDSTTVGLYG